MQRAWRGETYCSAFVTQDHQVRDGLTHSGPGPPTYITNQENTLQTCYSPILWRHLLNRDSLLSDDSSVCQADVKLGSFALGGKGECDINSKKIQKRLVDQDES